MISTINYKAQILQHICYTPMVYQRVNKKLGLDLSIIEIEKMIVDVLNTTNMNLYIKSGKNIYITNKAKCIRLTVNYYTNRLITVDKI